MSFRPSNAGPAGFQARDGLWREGDGVFDILITIMGDIDNEAEALAFAQDIEDRARRASRLGVAIEVWDNHRATVLRRRVLVPPADRL